MLVGLDFDNTIVCYDGLFHRLAHERGLIPAELPTSKSHVRDHLRTIGREPDWTELQGVGYGPRLVDANPFPGVKDFLSRCRNRGVECVIISHKTRHPYLGPKYDLHEAAQNFLQTHGFYETAVTGLSKPSVHLELTKESKLERIGSLNCDFFIDDLPEFLGEPSFPARPQRILFDPAGVCPDEHIYRRAKSWDGIAEIILGNGGAHLMLGHTLPQHAAQLASSAQLGNMHTLSPLAGGANNRVFLLEAEKGVALLKVYFRHPDDPRDRLGTEFAFARFAWSHGVRSLPEPLECDTEAGLGLFEYIPGRLLDPTEVDESALAQACAFFLDLNRHRHVPEAVKLPVASEACFSLENHFNLVQKRVDRLIDLPVQSVVDVAARAFVTHELSPAWSAILNQAKRHAQVERIALTEPLKFAERCLSPSDFGYHNALLAGDGRLRFVDFEYSGWDDPAKLICDFFCQPAIPAPLSSFEQFAQTVAAAMPHSDMHLARARLLLPVYRLKWCCIVLNEFLVAGGRRRQFSGTSDQQDDRKIAQLEKARGLLYLLTHSHLSTRQVA